MTPAPDPETVSWARFALASFTVVGLMAGLAWALKFFTTRGWLKAGLQGQGRIKLLSSMPLDTRRRVVLVECDKDRYLLLLGPNSDLLLSGPSSSDSNGVPS